MYVGLLYCVWGRVRVSTCPPTRDQETVTRHTRHTQQWHVTLSPACLSTMLLPDRQLSSLGTLIKSDKIISHLHFPYKWQKSSLQFIQTRSSSYSICLWMKLWQKLLLDTLQETQGKLIQVVLQKRVRPNQPVFDWHKWLVWIERLNETRASNQTHYPSLPETLEFREKIQEFTENLHSCFQRSSCDLDSKKTEQP